MKIFPVQIIQDEKGKFNKVPLVKWKSEAVDTTDTQTIKKWQEHFRDRIHYWGTPTGKEADLLVLDVDTKDNGYETLKQFDVPRTRSQRTRSGGMHYFFRYPQDGYEYGNRTKFLEGLDIRGEGGYVVLYELDTLPITDAPEWVASPCPIVTGKQARRS